MRPKIVIPVLACAVTILVAFLWLRDPSARLSENQPASAAIAPQSNPPVTAAAISNPETMPSPPAAQPSAPSGTPDYSEWVRETQAHLLELSSSDDPESLRSILVELTSTEPDIRKTALAATRQFGSRDAIPYLQEAADHTDDAREKVRILDAIDFLKMPSLTELRELANNSAPSPNR